MVEDSVQSALLMLSAYRSISSTQALDKTNPLLLPQQVRITDKGGVGPRKRILVFGDNKGVEAHIANTDSAPSVRMCVHIGLLAFEIVTSSRGTTGVAQQHMDITKLNFEAYSSLLVLLKELVAIHQLPVEWAACWLLQNSNKIPLYDSYVKCGTTARHLGVNRLRTAGQVLVTLEGHNIGAYLPNSSPKLISVISVHNSEANSEAKDAVPLPLLFIRRSSRVMEDNAPYYFACSGEEACEQAIHKYHFHTKTAEPKMRGLDASNVARLVEKMLQTHILIPLPYLSISESRRSAELFS